MTAVAVAELPLKHTTNDPRGFSDAALMYDCREKQEIVRGVEFEELGFNIPKPNKMPNVEDDGKRPSYTYAMLIGMAILCAPERRLPLALIYKWISDTFTFYRNTQERRWQNGIRYNLSASKHFSKQDRSKEDHRKGHYWIINPGFEKQYYKVKAISRPTELEDFVPAYPSDLPRPSASRSASLPSMIFTEGSDSSKITETEDDNLSDSDATIPCSDSTAHDGYDSTNMPPPRTMSFSRRVDDAQSSQLRRTSQQRPSREDSRPRGPRFPSNSSRAGGRKRKFDHLADSGYYSSIKSSAIRGSPLGRLLPFQPRSSAWDGRAEEGIARVRDSSYEYRSKTRPHRGQLNTSQPMLSPSHASEALKNPLTPAIVFMPPALPSASVSPNANLRNHRNKMRELVGGSPDKSLTMWCDTSFLDAKDWSPAISMPHGKHVDPVGKGSENTFDISGRLGYNESSLMCSIGKQRLRIGRAVAASGVLAEVTGSKSRSTNSPTPKRMIASSFINVTNLSPIKGTSPLKQPQVKFATSTPLAGLGHSLHGPSKQDGLPSLTSAGSFSAPSTQLQSGDDDDIFTLLHSEEFEPSVDPQRSERH
ncbi:hypothetical protein E8E12_000975 [Didymella heteroderae]|uniref:Fork-head domain-containing protein n=1 Tax=Didymella heteroderae TaxID=1769908 RepID=A0A9P4WFP3_9PLEO|nr:hypothetical protein E8E12_000975 [Didymella heteroderae]